MREGNDDNGKSNRLLGTYALPAGQTAVGELSLSGPKTLLRLHSDEFLRGVECGSFIKGTAYNGECVSLIDCISPGTGHTSIKDGPTKYHAEVFPHYVAIGHRHVDPTCACVASVHFTTTDLTSLFYDFDAFSHVIDARPIIDAVLSERRVVRAVEAGENPLVSYYTGKDCIAEVQTEIGKVSVRHRPTYSLGGPEGVFIKNHIVVSIEPETPVIFNVAINRVYEVCCFLSMAAGRAQGIDRIDISIRDESDEMPQALTVHPSYRWKSGGGGEMFEPHPGDMPLDPIGHKDEFSAVLSNWIARHPTWRSARGRYLECLRKAHKYGPERLVAAANMFDILPSDAVPLGTSLNEELEKTRDVCAQMFRRLPPGLDRDGALSALGRIGQPSLPKKVAHRVSVVDAKFGNQFPELGLVTSIAVKCRNYYVHGSLGDLNFDRVEPLIHFLTDALEFVFAASDLIEAGWEPARWTAEPKGWGHTFARFRSNYSFSLAELRQAVGQ